MEWNFVEFDDFPLDLVPVLGLVKTIEDEGTEYERYWSGLVQVHFRRMRGWICCQTCKNVHVEMWTELPGKYKDGEFIPNNGKK